jgi:hypothetical protein
VKTGANEDRLLQGAPIQKKFGYQKRIKCVRLRKRRNLSREERPMLAIKRCSRDWYHSKISEERTRLWGHLITPSKVTLRGVEEEEAEAEGEAEGEAEKPSSGADGAAPPPRVAPHPLFIH